MSKFHTRTAPILARTHAPTHKKRQTHKQTNTNTEVFVYMYVCMYVYACMIVPSHKLQQLLC